MPNYHEIKETELETTKDYSDKKFDKYLRSHKLLKSLHSELFFWSISLIPFFIYPLILDNTIGMWLFFIFCHMLFWTFWGKKEYHKICDESIEELELHIQVLEDIKEERKK